MVCPYSLSIPGGVQAQVLGLARQLRRRGHEVRVLGPCDGPPPESFVTPLGDSLPTAANGSIAPLAPDPAATLRTFRVLRDEAFDVIHVHEPLAPGPPITTVTLHYAPTVGTFHAAGRSSGYKVLAPLLKRLIERIDHRVVVSKDALELVLRYLGGEASDYTVLFNGVDLAGINSVEPQPSDRPAIFFIGRHEQRKGLEVLLQAMRHLDDDVVCWVAGEGDETARLKIEFGDDPRVEWLGRITDAEKLARMRGASVFCAPSLHGESFGVVLLEAMAAGTPVVASALDGYRNVATDGGDALMVPPGDAGALAEAIRRVLHDRRLCEQLVERGCRRADELSMERLADQYLAIYQAVRRDPSDRPGQHR
jgi:phosphatidylinositol alpha-mannosyltransferase